MTKKQKILASALELFATKGYEATSVKEISTIAEVSVGLIFTHYKSKSGLLKAILTDGAEKSTQLISTIIMQKNGLDFIRAVLSIPFLIPENEYPYWQLWYQLKWHNQIGENTTRKELKKLLVDAFNHAKWPNAEEESELVIVLIDGICTNKLTNTDSTMDKKIEQLILNKYTL